MDVCVYVCVCFMLLLFDTVAFFNVLYSFWLMHACSFLDFFWGGLLCAALAKCAIYLSYSLFFGFVVYMRACMLSSCYLLQSVSVIVTCVLACVSPHNISIGI